MLPWTLVRDLDSNDREERAFASESFCPILFETQVGSADPVEFLDQAVTAWSGYVFAFVTPPWGAHPSSSPSDIQSGTGWVHNTPMLEGIEKTVLRHPITAKPKPVYFPSHRSAHVLMERMTALDENSSWARVPRVLAAAMKA